MSRMDLVGAQMLRRYKQPLETIGRCEGCGLVDHHLIEGECPPCRKPVHPVMTHRHTSTYFRLEVLSR